VRHVEGEVLKSLKWNNTGEGQSKDAITRSIQNVK
jgi:hypothetical protein